MLGIDGANFDYFSCFLMGTNDLRTTRNLDFVMGEVYALVATAKRKFRTADLF